MNKEQELKLDVSNATFAYNDALFLSDNCPTCKLDCSCNRYGITQLRRKQMQQAKDRLEEYENRCKVKVVINNNPLGDATCPNCRNLNVMAETTNEKHSCRNCGFECIVLPDNSHTMQLAKIYIERDDDSKADAIEQAICCFQNLEEVVENDDLRNSNEIWDLSNVEEIWISETGLEPDVIFMDWLMDN